MDLPFPQRTSRYRPRGGPAALLLTAATALLAPSAHAQNVSATYTTMTGGFFNYNFTVRNTTATTLADVSVFFPTNATGTNLAAPTGFQITFDSAGNGPNMGILDFETQTGQQDFFAGTTISGFLVRSNQQLRGSSFTTLDVNGNSASGTIAATAVPEPGVLGLLGLGAAPVAALFSNRRRVSVACGKG